MLLLSSRILLLALLGLSGCNVIGAVAYKVAGPPEVEAKYTLQQRPTLVLVENYRAPGVATDDLELLAGLIGRKLEEKKLVPLVSQEKLLEVKSQRPAQFHKLRIPEVGKLCGAEQVIYVDYAGGGVAAVGSAAYQGKAAAMVRVVDVATSRTLWPTDAADGFSVQFQTKMISSERNLESIRLELFEGLSGNVARLFHKWKPDDLDDHSND